MLTKMLVISALYDGLDVRAVELARWVIEYMESNFDSFTLSNWVGETHL